MSGGVRWLAPLLLLLSGVVGAETPRTLQLDVDILELSGPLDAKAFSKQLAIPALDVTGFYLSDKRIENVTARYQRVMPIGSKWFPIPQYAVVSGGAITRTGWHLRCSLPDNHPAHASYRLEGAALHVPMPAGVNGLPQPSLEVQLIDVLPEKGAKERTFSWRSADLALTLRVRSQWGN